MQPQEHNDIKFGKDYNLDSAYICGQLGFFFVYPFPPEQKEASENKDKKAVILTYREDISMKKLLQEYLQIDPSLADSAKQLCFVLSNGRKIPISTRTSALSKITRTPQIDGLVLFLSILDKNVDLKYLDYLQQGQQNQCAMQQFMSHPQEYKFQYNLNLNFKIPHFKDKNKQYTLTLRILDSETLKGLIIKFIDQVKKVFGVELKLQQIKSVKVQLIRGQKQLFVDDTVIAGIQSIVNWSTIIVNLSKYQFKPLKNNVQNRIILYKQNSSQYIIQPYEEIQFMTFRSLYHSKLVPQHKKKERQCLVCLKVMDIVIRHDQNLSKIEGYYKVVKEREKISIVGRVVSQKMYFFKSMASLSDLKQNHFKIQDHIYPKQLTSKQQRQQFRERIRQKIEQRALTSTLTHFKDIHNVQPIFIYTCEDVHHPGDDDPSKSEPIYRIVNRYLRQEKIFNTQFNKMIHNWKYQFANLLIQQLRKIQPGHSATVFRGIDYDPKMKKGDIMTFKSFTSTSVNKLITLNFLKSSPNATLLQLQITNGKQIKMFSAFADEDEVLLQPYTQFKVQEEGTAPIMGKKVRKLRLRQMTQWQSSSEYPKSIANFIIWVDDKKAQGQFIYNNIQPFEHPTILVQLNSTEQLVQWLNQDNVRRIMEDPTANIVFVTNMTRQNNHQAGIQAILELQKYKFYKDVPIMVYIGDKERARKKLKDRRKEIKNYENIQIGNQMAEMENFLQKHLKIDFKEKHQAINQKGQKPCEIM